METTKLSSKGQVILPKSIRAEKKWKPGLQFAVEVAGEGVLLRPLKRFKPTTVAEVFGCAGYRGPRKSLKDMETAILKEARRQK